ncbi:hypothetical protein SKAU_G00336110 [Synaphobranchus kaupii]|uniref:Glycoprotein hormone beta-5 n=1 Tax=Synaphobranchus kaupii TaxID=118154 RepID=A0A9Q1EM90_SYNKA|nr:hypothetical protein SKAU_G00336110 [Synaphobranchus kaupii]
MRQLGKEASWCRVALCCAVLLTGLGPTATGEAHVNLRRFIGCAVREFTFLARKPGCGALHITTDACWGRCETWEKPVLDAPFIESYQRVCTYNETRTVTVKLPNCSAQVDPSYTYPVALSSHDRPVIELKRDGRVAGLRSEVRRVDGGNLADRRRIARAPSIPPSVINIEGRTAQPPLGLNITVLCLCIRQIAGGKAAR